MHNYLRAANVGWNGLILDDVKRMNFTEAEMKVFRLEPGDILLNEASGSPREVGKPALWAGEIADCAFQNTLLRVRPTPRVDSKYLLHFLLHQASSGAFARGSRGVGIHHLGRDALSKWKVPLPNLDEQRRIAAILDRADGLRLKQTTVVTCILALTRAVYLQMFGPRGSDRKSGHLTTIGESLKLKSGQFLPATKQVPGPIAVYGGNGINGYHAEAMFETPKVVVGRVGAYCGAVHLTDGPSWVTDNALWVSEMPAGMMPEYLSQALRMAALNAYASQSGQPLISAGRIADVELFVPSESSQQAFTSRVQRIQRLSVVAGEKLSELRELFASLQSRAFSGQL